MKFVNLVVSSLLLSTSSVLAFKNALPLFIQQNGDTIDELTYVLKENTKPICSILSSKKNIVIQIPNLSNQDLFNGQKQVPQVAELIKSEFFKFTPFYKYNTSGKKDVKCADKETKNFDIIDLDDEEWLSNLENLDENTDEILVFTFPKLSSNMELRTQQLLKMDSYINIIVSLIKDNENFKIIIQGLPFTSESNVNIFGSLESLLLHKREDETEVASIDYDKLQQEVDEAFKEIEGMLENEGDNIVVISSGSNSTDGGLFEHYQFFTPGIWMGTLVSFFLLSILIILFQWLNSLQISYKSFEKQVDFQKKTQ